MTTASLFLLFFFAAATTALADGAIQRDLWLARDPRLINPVTIVRQHVRIGELLQEAARQTGVSLASNRYDMGDSIILTVYERKMPLVDLLSSVCSLVGYQQAEWKWEIRGDGAKTPYAYQLDYPPAARDFPLSVRNRAQKFFEETMEASVEALTASLARVAELKAKYPDVRFTQTPLENAKIKAFVSFFSATERLKLARQQIAVPDPITIPSSEWTSEMNAYIEAATDYLKKGSESVGIPYNAPAPDKATAWCSYLPGSLAPDIWFCVGKARWSVFGSTSMESDLGERLQSLWMLDGDHLTDEAKEAMLVPKEPLRPKLPYESYWDETHQFRQLNEFNQLTGVPIFLRDADDTFVQPVYGRPVAGFVKDLRDHATNVKWHGNALLVSGRGWIRHALDDADKLAPWQGIQRLRDHMIASGDADISFEDMTHLAYDFTPAQLEVLAKGEDLLPPNMFVATADFCRTIARLSPLLAPLSRHPELISRLETDEGVRVRELPKEMRDYLATQTSEEITPDFRFRIRADLFSPERHPNEWRGWSPKGMTFGTLYYPEMGKPGGKMMLIGGGGAQSLGWVTRDAALLNTSRLDPEADLRIPAFKRYGNPNQEK